MSTAQREVLAYSAMEDTELAEYAALIRAEHPDLSLIVERMSSTALRERLLHEGQGGRWDVVFGWSLTHLADPDILPLLAPLDGLDASRLPASAVARDRRWFSPSGFVPAFCVDQRALERQGRPVPRTWRELADPALHGQIVLPDPRRSGAGFLHLQALLQCAGPDYAWQALRGVAAGAPQIVHSANAPCLAVAEGRAAIGVSVSTSTATLIGQGHALSMVIPTDAAAFEPEGFAMRRGSPRAEAALQALQWTLGDAAAAAYRRYNKLALVRAADGGADATADLRPLDVEAAIGARDSACRDWATTFAA